MLVVKIARGAALTGSAASLAVFVFLVVHAADGDPWQWPAAFMCMTTWFITWVLVAWHRGQSYDSPQPSLLQPLDGLRTATKEMIGVLLASALLLAFNAPAIRMGYEGSRSDAKMRSFRQANGTKEPGRIVELSKGGDSPGGQEEALGVDRNLDPPKSASDSPERKR